MKVIRERCSRKKLGQSADNEHFSPPFYKRLDDVVQLELKERSVKKKLGYIQTVSMCGEDDGQRLSTQHLWAHFNEIGS